MNNLQQTLFNILKYTKIHVQPGVMNVDVLLEELKERNILSEGEAQKIHDEMRRVV